MICVINCSSKKTLNFIKILDSKGVENELIKMEDISSTDFSKYSGIIISGAPILLTEVDQQQYLDMFEFLKEYDKPVLGVCFGHQVIGLLHGGEVTMGEEAREFEDINIIKDDPIFAGIESGSSFREDHCEHLSLPEGFDLLANSKSCVNEAMKHQTKTMYGVQFHPEVSGEVGERFLNNFAGMC